MVEKVKNLFQKGAIDILMGTFLTKFVSLFSSIILVRVFTKNDYGVLGFIDNIYGYLFIFAGYGLSKALVRYMVLGKNDEEKSAIFFYSIKSGTIFNFLLIIIGVFFSAIYIKTTTFADYFVLVIICLLQIEFNFIINSVLYTERALFRTKRFAWMSVGISVSIVITKLIGGVTCGVTGAVVFLTIFEGVLAVYLLLHESKQKFHYKGKLEYTIKKGLNSFAVQVMLTDGLWSIFLLNDVFLLGQLCNDATIIAEYKVACVLPAQLAILSTAIGMFVEPYFTKKFQEGDINWVQNKWIRLLGVTFITVFSCALVLIVFSKQLIVLIYGTKYENISSLMRLLCVAYIMNAGLRFTTANILSAIGEVKYNLFISVVGILLQVIIDITIIPKYGAIGAAISNIIVYSVMAVMVNATFYFKFCTKGAFHML